MTSQNEPRKPTTNSGGTLNDAITRCMNSAQVLATEATRIAERWREIAGMAFVIGVGSYGEWTSANGELQRRMQLTASEQKELAESQQWAEAIIRRERNTQGLW